MKKLFYFFMLFSLTRIELFAQIRDKSDGHGTFDACLVRPREYVILREPFLVDGRSGLPVAKKSLSPGAIIRPSFFGRIWVDFLEYNRGELEVIDCKDGDETIYVSVDDIAVAHSAVLPGSVVTKINTALDHYWLPAYTLDIVQSRERDTIFAYEAGRLRKYLVEHTDYWWHEIVPFPSEVRITNTFIDIRYAVLSGSFYSLIQKIDADGYRYHITLSISSWKETFKEKTAQFTYTWNFPEIRASRHESFLLELNAAHNRMRIYNSETKRVIFDLVKVSNDFYEKYIEFIQTNIVPEDLVIPPDLLAGWPEDIKIAPPWGGEKTRIMANTNLRLRASPDTGGEILRTLAEGESVTVLEPGLSATIDGITAPWVWVETRDGIQGWCFAGYLGPIKVRPVSLESGGTGEVIPEETILPLDTEPLPLSESLSETRAIPGYLFFPAGGLLICGGLVITILRKRGKKSTTSP
jgi:hypothetical protein